MEFENITNSEDLSKNEMRVKLTVHYKMPNIELGPWELWAEAIRKAAQIRWTAWKTESDFMHHYRVTRYSLGGKWMQFNVADIELAQMPDMEEILIRIRQMTDELYQPIIDLDWENYFLVPINWENIKSYPDNLPHIHQDSSLTIRVWNPETKSWDNAPETGRTSEEGEGSTITR